VKNFLSARLGWVATSVLAAGALLLALLFAHALKAYWDYYYLDAPGSSVAVEFFVAPAAFILALGCAAVVARALLLRTRRRLALPLGLAAAALLLAVLLATEIAATGPARRAEGGGDLTPYLTYHLHPGP
jgi:hypothetical protein